MARKSRRALNAMDTPNAAVLSAGERAVVIPEKEKAVVYPTAIYVRLSVENSGKDDNGASIENQTDICKEFVSQHPDLQLIKVYKDNGWTGTVMDRPAFNEMMKDASAGIVNCIVVRDLSRFGRNYIETGSYIETMLPEMGIRFISVKEDYDSFKSEGNDDLMVKLQNLINHVYAMDISRKVESALRTQREEGRYNWHHIAYGYKWNKDHTNIIPDEVTAPFVLQIFTWRAEGVTKREIARRLNECQAPREYADKKTTRFEWSISTINHILRNPAYVGIKALGRSHSAIYKGIKHKRIPEQEWIITKNAHMPLVSEETYRLVHQMEEEERDKWCKNTDKTKNERSKIENFYKGKIFCADCGSPVYIHRHKRIYGNKSTWFAEYNCGLYLKDKDAQCASHNISKKELDECVLKTIQMHAAIAVDYEKVIQDIRKGSADKGFKDSINNQIRSVSIKLNAIRNKRQTLYENYISGILDAEEYKYAKSRYEGDFEDLNKRLEYLTERERETSEALSSGNKWVNLLKGKKSLKKLSKELADAMIERIEIGEGKRIHITFKYKDVYDLTKECIEEIKGEKKNE